MDESTIQISDKLGCAGSVVVWLIWEPRSGFLTAEQG